MTVFGEAFRRMVADELKCPKCPATNRPGAYLIRLDETGARAFCDQCSFEGVVALFQPKENTR